MNSYQKTTCYKRVLAGIHPFAAIVLVFVSSFFFPAVVAAQNNPVKDITIHQEINFKARPEQLYEALLSSKQFSESTKKSFDNFTAASASIDPVAGGAFSVFDGVITGRIVELVPNQRIVEAWRAADWPAGVYSIARFELKPQGSGTLLVFDHIGFPEGLKEHLSIGWQEHYWAALMKYLQ